MKDSFIAYVPLDLISENPYQVRQEIPHDHIGNLASDIRMNGLLQNPAGRPVDANGNLIEYIDGCEIQLAYGHNRHQAYYLLSGMYPDQYDKLPVKIVSYTDEEMALAAWSENESRKQLNPVDRAMTFQKWTEKFGWTQQQIADKVRLERSTVTNLLRLLSLPAEVLGLVAEGTISQRQATALIPYYELPHSESESILDQDGFSTFLFNALKGGVSSDSIRDRITAAIAEIHPAPPQFNFTTPAVAPETGEGNTGSEADAGQENVITDETGSEQAWLQKDINGNDVPPEPVPPIEEPIVAAPAPVIPVNQPALPPAPVNHPASPTPSPAQIKQTSPEPATPATPAEPKPWPESNFTVTLGFMPVDGDENGRKMYVTTRRGEGLPTFTEAREKAWNWNFPWQLQKLIDDLHPEDFQVEA